MTCSDVFTPGNGCDTARDKMSEQSRKESLVTAEPAFSNGTAPILQSQGPIDGTRDRNTAVSQLTFEISHPLPAVRSGFEWSQLSGNSHIGSAVDYKPQVVWDR